MRIYEFYSLYQLGPFISLVHLYIRIDTLQLLNCPQLGWFTSGIPTQFFSRRYDGFFCKHSRLWIPATHALGKIRRTHTAVADLPEKILYNPVFQRMETDEYQSPTRRKHIKGF